VSPPSAREAALLALHQRLQAVPDATVLRNEVGVRPWGRTGSGRGFDRLPGVVVHWVGLR
jgi:hypothetical protein